MGLLFMPNAYCLMTNHYHILIEIPNANLPQIMKHLNDSGTFSRGGIMLFLFMRMIMRWSLQGISI